MTPRQIKYETKQLGYLIVVNSLIWINVFLGWLVKLNRIEDAIRLGLITYILGLVLLLGRQVISTIICKYLDTRKK